MRRLRAGTDVPPLPGGPGTRSGGTKAAPQGACWTGTAPMIVGPPKRHPPTRGRRQGRRIGAETRKRGPGEQKSPPWSAERRPHPSKEDAARRKTTGAPLGAPPPRSFEGHDEGPAPAGRAPDPKSGAEG